ncbi:MAG: NusG domain II-containing protein [Clostridia bacterium]|nr:NusG domain II-containing protein [Clostridia bacterium]
MKVFRPYFRKADLIIVLLVIITAVTGFAFLCLKESGNDTPASLEIRVNTKLIKEINLKSISAPYEIEVQGNFPVTLEISSEGVRFISSDCPDKLCIHQGIIKANESAACLPAGVSVTVKGQGEPYIDGIVG